MAIVEASGYVPGVDLAQDHTSIYAPLVIGIVLAGLGVGGIVTGPLWAAFVLLAFAAVSVGLDWRTRNRLQTLSENLAARTK